MSSPLLNAFVSVIPNKATRNSIRESIRENAQLDLRFVFMNFLAGTVACYGLLADSTATVIGAMVMATLLGAISGVALAIVERDSELLRGSLKAVAAGVALVFTISLVIGWLHRWLPLSEEILARTHPNILDLAIGIAGGAAGAYAIVSPRVNAALVGVAIATALVPPVAVCGLCLARGETRLALGALELFLTNLAAIQFVTSIMMWLFGFRPRDGLSLLGLLRRNRASIAVLALLAVFLSLNLVRTVRRFQLETSIRQHITRSIDDIENAELIRLSFDYQQQRLSATAVIVTPEKFPRAVVDAINTGMPRSPAIKIDTELLYILSDKFEEQPKEEALLKVALPDASDPRSQPGQ